MYDKQRKVVPLRWISSERAHRRRHSDLRRARFVSRMTATRVSRGPPRRTALLASRTAQFLGGTAQGGSVAGVLRIGDIEVRMVPDFDDQEWAADVLLPDATPEALEEHPDFAPPESYNADTHGLRLQFGGFLFEVDGRRI